MKTNKIRIILLFFCSLCLLFLYIVNKHIKFLESRKLQPRIVIGIFSKQDNICLRNAQRRMFISQARIYTRLDIETIFLLDEPTPALEEERKTYNDIMYLNSTVRGWNQAFAWKLYIWYKIVVDNFPDTDLVGRMDDDVFCCTPQMFDRLRGKIDPFLYYGYKLGVKKDICPTEDCADDMFLFVGINLVRDIIKSKLCHGKLRDSCLRSQFPWKNVRHWIHMLSNRTKIVHDNAKMIYFYGPSLGERRIAELYNRHKNNFCKNKLLFHKANSRYIYQMNRDNAMGLADVERVNFVDDSLKNASKCV